MWNFRGQKRPDFAIEPGPGQESAWDYPRPPVARRSSKLVEVRHGESLIAATQRSYRLLETASPPTFYLPPDDVDWTHLVAAPGSSICEWKGAAEYFALADDPDTPVAWRYPRPRAASRTLLRRLDYRRRGRTVQGRTGHRTMVDPQDPAIRSSTYLKPAAQQRRYW